MSVRLPSSWTGKEHKRNLKTRTREMLHYLSFSHSQSTQGSCGGFYPVLPLTARAATASPHATCSLPASLSKHTELLTAPQPATPPPHTHPRLGQEAPLAASGALLQKAVSPCGGRNCRSELLMGQKSLSTENGCLKQAKVRNTDSEVSITQQRFKTMELT